MNPIIHTLTLLSAALLCQAEILTKELHWQIVQVT